jgi:L-ascorbate metabolism protein UlaG (beta-lactamase superfamily)
MEPFYSHMRCARLQQMNISWYGQSCYKIDTKDAVLAIDPYGKEIGLTPPRFQADLVLVTHQHPDHSNAASIAGEPRVITSPGEYEVKGVAVRGIPSFHDREEGRERGPNTIYRIDAEGMSLVHLGDFGEEKLREETLEAIGDVDILFVPVGGTYTVDGNTAAKIVNQIEPRVVIPMHYAIPGLSVKLDAVEPFLKAYGAQGAEKLDKLVIKKKDLPEDTTRVVVLSTG